MNCSYCSRPAQYRDRASGAALCPEHARLEVTGPALTPSPSPRALGEGVQGARAEVRPATPADRERISALAHHFWGETLVYCFDREYEVLDSPAFLACVNGEIVGLLAYLPEPVEDCLTIIMLNMLPDYQGRGAGRALLDAAISEARRLGLGSVRISTTNDDLPAIYTYQRAGFHLTGLATGALLAHHGGVETGFADLPVRDEVRLAFSIQ